jgi:hypothetical protein
MQISIKTAPNGACIINIDAPEASQPVAATLSAIEPTPIPTIGSTWQGGKYAGISRGEDGQPDAHIILLEAQPSGDLNWQDATSWAAGLGNDARLPTKVEAALLYANLKAEFETSDWYWTSTPYSASDAWVQYFRYGSQGNYYLKSTERLCRAVRRFPL